MSDGERSWLLFLADMQQFCGKIRRYANGLSQEQFFASDMACDAVFRNLELLGEAAKQIPLSVRERYPDVPWRRISGLRDVLAHAYFGPEEDTIWQIIQDSVPALAQQLECVAQTEAQASSPSLDRPQ